MVLEQLPYCIVMVFQGYNFDFLTTSQEIGWKERLRYDLFLSIIGWDVKS